jgi:hypothetical protein
LIPLIPQDDDAAGGVASVLPFLGANWENLNVDNDNEEDEHENDVVKEVGKDAGILENHNEHATKRQACEAEKKKLIEDGLAWTVGQITSPHVPGIRGFNFEAFQTLKNKLKAKHQSRQSHKQKHHSCQHQNLRPCLNLLLHFWPADWRQTGANWRPRFNAKTQNESSQLAREPRSSDLQARMISCASLVSSWLVGSMARVEVACGGLVKSNFIVACVSSTSHRMKPDLLVTCARS